VLGVLPGIIGTLQANEVIKLILGFGMPAIGKLTTFDAADFEFKSFKLRADPSCPVCGKNPTITEPIDYEQFCGVPAMDPLSLEETKREAQRAKEPVAPQAKRDPSLDDRGLPPAYPLKADVEVTPREVKSMLDRKEPFFFVDCRNPNEYEITKIDGATLMPLPQIQQFGEELKKHKEEKVIVFCKVGGRSMQFAQILRQNGFKDVKSMAGGIALWNKDVNPGGPQY
jgi:rhodanese-related sulfurtransferase